MSDKTLREKHFMTDQQSVQIFCRDRLHKSLWGEIDDCLPSSGKLIVEAQSTNQPQIMFARES